ncbi:hypothetical protein BD779DRAFT_1469582 [Infundibulicybe gibba]|nr:hypothetical protein BD779DRAFT_1469582 [Infundibulicybe gibba]
MAKIWRSISTSGYGCPVAGQPRVVTNSGTGIPFSRVSSSVRSHKQTGRLHSLYRWTSEAQNMAGPGVEVVFVPMSVSIVTAPASRAIHPNLLVPHPNGKPGGIMHAHINGVTYAVSGTEMGLNTPNAGSREFGILIAPRPNRWIEPNLRDPLPPPSQCQLNPFLQHINTARPAMLGHWAASHRRALWTDDGRDSTFTCGQSAARDIPISSRDAYLCRAEDSLSKFQWPVTIRSPVGITCEDIFAVVYENFRRHVSEAEVTMWSSLRRKQASVAFHARFGHRIQDEMRRIDYFGQCIMFRGLEPHPSGRGWVLFLGLA